MCLGKVLDLVDSNSIWLISWSTGESCRTMVTDESSFEIRLSRSSQAGTGEGVDCNIRLVSPGCDEGLVDS